MYTCPECGGFLQFHVCYCGGQPFVYYTCPECGYDSTNSHTVTSVSTSIDTHNLMYTDFVATPFTTTNEIST